LAHTRHPPIPPLKTGCGDDQWPVHPVNDSRQAYGGTAVNKMSSNKRRMILT
jgi:hypothetical protein